MKNHEKLRFLVSHQKISDLGNAEKLFLFVEYVHYMYRILFDGSKFTKNTEEKWENCLSQIFIGC